MSEWQPIETAPKDGGDIDLWAVNDTGVGYRIADGYWTVNGLKHGYEHPRLYKEGWAAPNHGWDGDDGSVFDRVTHWMPLPDAPE